jgi:hypothetical protein
VDPDRVISTCALLLVLLHFGRRWSTLDLLAQCLLFVAADAHPGVVVA